MPIDLGSIFRTAAGTVGQQQQQGQPGQQPGFWGQYGPSIASLGLGVLGNVLQSNAYNQSEQWRQKIIQQELARRNVYENAAAPSLMGALGYRSPAAGQQLQAQLGSPSVGGQGTGGGATGTYSAGGAQPSKLANVLGVGGGMAGLAGSIAPKALGGALPFVGAGMLGAGLVANQIGQGRRTANTLVQGAENPFGADLAKISQMASTNPQQAAAMLQEKYGNYRAVINQGLAAGGNQAKVAQQSLNNPLLNQTIDTLAGQLGLRNLRG